jgi:hypothetical protein
MTRIEFTVNIVALLKQMIDLGEHPVIDFVKRTAAEQKRLFDTGLSKCDGYTIISKHQTGRAMDIPFIEDGRVAEPKLGFDHWHKVWEGWGGQPQISWDRGHFEG